MQPITQTDYDAALLRVRSVIESQDGKSVGVFCALLRTDMVALLNRLDALEVGLADVQNTTCTYCQFKTERKGRALEEYNREWIEHMKFCEKRPELALMELSSGQTALWCLQFLNSDSTKQDAMTAISDQYGTAIDTFLETMQKAGELAPEPEAP